MLIFGQKKTRRVLKNDFSFQSKSKNVAVSKISFQNKLFGFLSCSALIIIFGLLIWHPTFQIRIITLYGLKRTDYTEVRRTAENILSNKRFGFFPRNNYFLIDQSELEEIIISRFFFEKAVVTKKFPNSLIITIHERQPVAIIQKGNSLNLVDTNASIVEKLSSSNNLIIETATTSSSTLPTFSRNDLPLLIYSVESKNQTYRDNEIVGGVLAWNNFITKSLNLSVLNYLIETETSGVIFTKDGWRILANFIENREAQFIALNTVLKQKNFSTKDLQYVDVRYPGRVYWQ